MTKYYIQSGDIREVVVANSPNEAAQKAIRKGVRNNKNAAVGMITSLSEKSFDNFLSKEEEGEQRLILTSLVLRNMPEFREAYEMMKEEESFITGKNNETVC